VAVLCTERHGSRRREQEVAPVHAELFPAPLPDRAQLRPPARAEGIEDPQTTLLEADQEDSHSSAITNSVGTLTRAHLGNRTALSLMDAAWAIREAMKVCEEAEDLIAPGGDW